jgi:hypothetical protein
MNTSDVQTSNLLNSPTGQKGQAMADPKKITRNGMKVYCYGDWQEDSNALVVYEDADGEDCEDFFCDGATSWTDAVSQVTAWAAKNGFTVDEMKSC